MTTPASMRTTMRAALAQLLAYMELCKSEMFKGGITLTS
jgi:hypothetical protein